MLILSVLNIILFNVLISKHLFRVNNKYGKIFPIEVQALFEYLPVLLSTVIYFLRLHFTSHERPMLTILRKNWSFSIKDFSVNVTKSAVFRGFGHIYWRNPEWKTSFFVQCQIRLIHFLSLYFLQLQIHFWLNIFARDRKW